MASSKRAADSNLKFLIQGAGLLRRLDGGLYRGGSDLLPGGSLGAHFRHCLDFYEVFLSGLASGRIDYDLRERSTRVESDPARALEALGRIQERLQALEQADLDREIQVRGDAIEDRGWSRSTVGRELRYLLSHTIHHYALIGSILRSRGFALEADFGVAPSTLRHWEETGATAS